MVLELGGIKIEFVKHASTKIVSGSKVIYIDPYVLPSSPGKADLVLVTHEHYDHFDPAKIKKISKGSTEIMTNERCCAKLDGNISTVKVRQTIEKLGVSVTGVQAYNISKPYHPKGLGIGFVVESRGKRIYHAGDTDFIPEMNELKNIDVALLPIGGTYTMNVDEAVRAVNAIKPEIVVPIHYNVVDGTEANPEEFKEKVGSAAKVEIFYR
ncbi:MAG: hypothetical protein QT03_C0001G1368 [archaeon GW2011_AR10]|uniref:MBL fold metallo-hydrolase n=1 Tax=Candidatus Iainarchaeum sp. TaxID=3101447 RepID=A0A7J4IQQ9_9ARCH|nr:MAG: hypothetical protein QT03_C0001G1368 [archaeon GW2011_AR10]HIH07828.1 MBL fold metallo-hydrolase [Candidatus Diapherotrites archaeon]